MDCVGIEQAACRVEPVRHCQGCLPPPTPPGFQGVNFDSTEVAAGCF